jgi:hypothetical protein
MDSSLSPQGIGRHYRLGRTKITGKHRKDEGKEAVLPKARITTHDASKKAFKWPGRLCRIRNAVISPTSCQKSGHYAETIGDQLARSPLHEPQPDNKELLNPS